MTKAEIEKKIEDVQKAQFMNAMNDHWSADDIAFDRKCNEDIKKLKALIEWGEYDDAEV